jgi:molybdopterin molybdotransferase
MDDFFKVTDLDTVLEYRHRFRKSETEVVFLEDAHQRVLAQDVYSDMDLPEFSRSTMDGYAVMAASTFGASMGSPAWLSMSGSIAMGEQPAFEIGPGEAARIATGGMLPKGADSVVMIEFTEAVDEHTLEVYKSVAPGQNLMEKGEDFEKGKIILTDGTYIRPQEAGLMAAFGISTLKVYKKPVIGIVSTGDEVVVVSEIPSMGKIRDINTHTLRGQVIASGAIPKSYGIIRDNEEELYSICEKALAETDMVLISGGSSVGTRDYTTEVLKKLPDSTILFHGISISPGKPTLLAMAAGKAVWGLPGHVVSAMVVFDMVVKPFIQTLTGIKCQDEDCFRIPAILTRNVPSAQGREEFVRVKLKKNGDDILAEPLLGKS